MAEERLGMDFWSLSVSRQTDNQYWRRPRIERRGWHTILRLGWRFTAWGLHWSRQFLPDADVKRMADEGKDAVYDAITEREELREQRDRLLEAAKPFVTAAKYWTPYNDAEVYESFAQLVTDIESEK